MSEFKSSYSFASSCLSSLTFLAPQRLHYALLPIWFAYGLNFVQLTDILARNTVCFMAPELLGLRRPSFEAPHHINR